MFLKYPKSHKTFGLLLKDNLSPRTFKIAQSGHTGGKVHLAEVLNGAKPGLNGKWNVETFFKKWAIPGQFFFHFRLFNAIGGKQCSILDSNRGPLVSEAMALPMSHNLCPCNETFCPNNSCKTFGLGTDVISRKSIDLEKMTFRLNSSKDFFNLFNQ